MPGMNTDDLSVLLISTNSIGEGYLFSKEVDVELNKKNVVEVDSSVCPEDQEDVQLLENIIDSTDSELTSPFDSEGIKSEEPDEVRNIEGDQCEISSVYTLSDSPDQYCAYAVKALEKPVRGEMERRWIYSLIEWVVRYHADKHISLILALHNKDLHSYFGSPFRVIKSEVFFKAFSDRGLSSLLVVVFQHTDKEMGFLSRPELSSKAVFDEIKRSIEKDVYYCFGKYDREGRMKEAYSDAMKR